MIKIYRSSHETLRNLLFQMYEEQENSIYLSLAPSSHSQSKGFPCYWAGTRIIFKYFRSILDDTVLDEVVQQHKVAVSFLVSEEEIQLSKSEANFKRNAVCKLESNLTHNFFVQEPFYDLMTELFVALFKTKPVHVFIPDLEMVDVPTLTLLFNVFKTGDYGNSAIRLGLRADFDIETESTVMSNNDDKKKQFDEDGLIWHYSFFGIKYLIFSCIAMGGEIEELDAVDVAYNPAMEELPNWLEHDPEMELIRLLEINTEFDRQQADFAYHLIMRSFQTFDFSNTLSLALLVMKHQFPFADNQLADIHSILALATHNRQFSSSLGNDETNSFIEEHLNRAYALETNALKRSFLQYRMTVLTSRRQKDLEKGMEWANITLSHATDEDIPAHYQNYIKAWALNIRAYIHMVTRKLDLAHEDMVVANRCAASLSPHIETSRDFAFTTSVMADNMGALTELMGHLFEVKPWLTTSYKASGWHLTNKRFGARIWTESHLKTLRTDLAIKDTLIGLDAARKEANPFYEDLYLAHLGEFYHRVGDKEASLQYFKESLSLHQQYFSRSRYQNICLLAAKYALYAGFYEEGKALLNRLSGNLESLGEEHRFEYDLLSALSAAADGREEQAIAIGQQAFEQSMEKGELYQMIYVSGVMAELSGILGQEADQLELYRRGRELIDAESLQANSSATGTLCNFLLKYLGYDAHRNEVADLLPLLINRMSWALVRNAESWHNLPLLLKMVQEHPQVISDDAAEDLSLILIASTQRADCQDSFNAILAVSSERFRKRYEELKSLTDHCLHSSIENFKVAG